MELDPNVINKMVTEALVKSAIGETLDKQIREAVEKLSSSYNNPIRPTIESYVVQVVRDTVMTEYAEQIKTKVREYLTDEAMSEIALKAVEAVTSRSKSW